MSVTLAIETPLQDDVRDLVQRLNAHLNPLSPPEFQFQMTVEQMADSATTLFVARNEAGAAIGMGALKQQDAAMGEVKRMFTVPEMRGQRIGSALLEAIEQLAREKGLKVLMLETGSEAIMPEAHRLYQRGGFSPRGPFLDYPESPWSAFYEKQL